MKQGIENNEHSAWHTASVAAAAAPTTTSFTIIGTYQQKMGQ